MPNYEYKCTQDGSKFELWQEVGSEAPPCPSCGAPSKKVFGVPRVQFKGSGFYLTDLRAEQAGGKGGDKSEASETKTETPAAPKVEAKSDTPAAAPAAPTPAPSAPTK